MILADSSAWVEFLRRTGSAADLSVDRALDEPGMLATTDVVLMEILAGALDDDHRDRLRRLLRRCEFVATEGPADFEAAADIYRACRRAGNTIRALNDCLIAGIAIRSGSALLHADSDFDVIARHAPLRVA